MSVEEDGLDGERDVRAIGEQGGEDEVTIRSDFSDVLAGSMRRHGTESQEGASLEDNKPVQGLLPGVRHVLLVESDGALAEQISSALAAHRYEVAFVPSGMDALSRVGQLRPDLIVLGVELPQISGYVVCNKLRSDPALQTIPLILTSSDATKQTFALHRKLPTRADDYLIKPFSMEQLVQRVDVLTGAQPQPGPPSLKTESTTNRLRIAVWCLVGAAALGLSLYLLLSR